MLNPMAWGLGGGPFSLGPCHDPGTLAVIAMGAGTAVSAFGTLAAGNAAKASADYDSRQLQAKGKEELAAARVEADREKRKKDLALSSLTNRSAGSGFSATDPTALQLGDEISEYGTLQEQMAMYGGESRRVGLDAQAAMRRKEGKIARQASQIKAISTILSGGSSMADRYNPPRPAETAPAYRYGSASVGPGGWQTTVRYG